MIILANKYTNKVLQNQSFLKLALIITYKYDTINNENKYQ